MIVSFHWLEIIVLYPLHSSQLGWARILEVWFTGG